MIDFGRTALVILCCVLTGVLAALFPHGGGLGAGVALTVSAAYGLGYSRGKREAPFMVAEGTQIRAGDQ